MYFKSLLNSIRQLAFFDTFKHASTYFSGTMLIHGLGILTLPIFTAYFTDAEYGIVNVFNSFIPILAVFITFNIHLSTERYYHEKTDDYGQFLGSIFLFTNLLAFVIGSIGLYCTDSIAKILGLPPPLIKWLFLAAYCAAIVHAFFNNVMIATRQSKRYTTFQVFWHYGKFAATVALLIYMTNDASQNVYMGKIIGEGGVGIIVTIYAVIVGYKYMRFNGLAWKHIRYSLVFALPLIPFSLSNYLLTFFDQWFINITLGHSDAGLYSFAYKIGMIYMGLGVALTNGASPAYYEFMNNKEYDKVGQQVDSMSKLLVLGGGFLILFAVDVGTLLSSKDVFLKALPIAPVIVGAYLFSSLAIFYNRGILYLKKNAYLSSIIMASVGVNIVLNIWLVKFYGYQIAAYTTLVSYIIMLLLSILTTTYILKLPPLPLGRILKYIVFLGIVVLLNYTVGRPNVGFHFGWMTFKAVLFGSLAVALFYNKIGLVFNKNK